MNQIADIVGAARGTNRKFKFATSNADPMGCMQAEHAIVVAFVVFLVIGGAQLTLSVRRGRDLCGELAQRFPLEYEQLGQPNPGFFDSPRRSAYMRLIMQSEFTRIGDPYLVESFAELRRSEIRQLVFLLVGFGVLGAAAVWFEYLRATP